MEALRSRVDHGIFGYPPGPRGPMPSPRGWPGATDGRDPTDFRGPRGGPAGSAVQTHGPRRGGSSPVYPFRSGWSARREVVENPALGR